MDHSYQCCATCLACCPCKHAATSPRSKAQQMQNMQSAQATLRLAQLTFPNGFLARCALLRVSPLWISTGTSFNAPCSPVLLLTVINRQQLCSRVYMECHVINRPVMPSMSSTTAASGPDENGTRPRGLGHVVQIQGVLGLLAPVGYHDCAG